MRGNRGTCHSTELYGIQWVHVSIGSSMKADADLRSDYTNSVCHNTQGQKRLP